MSQHPIPAILRPIAARCINCFIDEHAAARAAHDAFTAAHAAEEARLIADGKDKYTTVPDPKNPRRTVFATCEAGAADPVYVAQTAASKEAHRTFAAAVDDLYAALIASDLGSIRPALPVLTRTASARWTQVWRYHATVGTDVRAVRASTRNDYRAAVVQLHITLDLVSGLAALTWDGWSFHQRDGLAQKEAAKRPRHGVEFNVPHTCTDRAQFSALTLVRAGGIVIPLTGA